MRLASLAASDLDDREVLRQVFIRFLSRPPTEKEIEVGLLALREAGDDVQLMLDELAEYEAGIPQRLQAWEERQGRPAVWNVVAPQELSATNGATLELQEDQSILVSGAMGKSDYALTLETPMKRITGLRIEALADKSLPAGGPGRAPNGNFVLGKLVLQAAPLNAGEDAWTEVAFDAASASFNQSGFPPINALNDNERAGWAIAPQFNKSHIAVFQLKEDVVGGEGMRLRLTMKQSFDGEHQLGRFRVALTDSTRPINYQNVDTPLAKLLSVPPNQRNPRQTAELEDLYRKQDSQLRELERRVETAAQQRDNRRLSGLQDLAWALINNPAFLFNY